MIFKFLLFVICIYFSYASIAISERKDGDRLLYVYNEATLYTDEQKNHSLHLKFNVNATYVQINQPTVIIKLLKFYCNNTCKV